MSHAHYRRLVRYFSLFIILFLPVISLYQWFLSLFRATNIDLGDGVCSVFFSSGNETKRPSPWQDCLEGVNELAASIDFFVHTHSFLSPHGPAYLHLLPIYLLFFSYFFLFILIHIFPTYSYIDDFFSYASPLA